MKHNMPMRMVLGTCNPCGLFQRLFGRRGREGQRFQLFASSALGGRNLMFRDVTEKLLILSDEVDINQILGLDYVALLKGLGHEGRAIIHE